MFKLSRNTCTGSPIVTDVYTETKVMPQNPLVYFPFLSFPSLSILISLNIQGPADACSHASGLPLSTNSYSANQYIPCYGFTAITVHILNSCRPDINIFTGYSNRSPGLLQGHLVILYSKKAV
jgi:hypothetical protein